MKPTGVGRGGKRKGSGRRPRPVNSYIFADLKAVIGDEINPLQVMLNAMRAAYQAAMKDPANVDMGLLKQAASWAQDAAPYCHPRLISHEVGGKGGAAIPLSLQATVAFYVPDNARRVAPPDAANEAVAKGNGASHGGNGAEKAA
jgi:hypothetical protein